MKHFIFSLFAAFAILTACGSPKPENKKGDFASTSVSNTDDVKSSVKLTKDIFIQKVWNYQQSPNEWKYLGNKPAIIDFYADWCGPCRIASPILEQIGADYAGKIVVYKVNTDQERELAQVFGISGIPSFLYIPASGKPVMMSGIGRTPEDTKQMFVDNIQKYLQVKK